MTLDVIGAGPLMQELVAEVRDLGLEDVVKFYGHLIDPYPLVAKADVFVLPSLSEGISRAALEALHLGVPCVLRKVDGNAELIQDGVNGILFDTDNALAEAMRLAATLSRRDNDNRSSLLPSGFRQREAACCFLKLVDSTK